VQLVVVLSDEGSAVSLSESWIVWSSLTDSSRLGRVALEFQTWKVRRAAL
jgi:hypothetical protein